MPLTDKKEIDRLAAIIKQFVDGSTPVWGFSVPDGVVCKAVLSGAGTSTPSPQACSGCLINWGTASGCCFDYIPTAATATKVEIEGLNNGVPTKDWAEAMLIDVMNWSNNPEKHLGYSNLSDLDPSESNDDVLLRDVIDSCWDDASTTLEEAKKRLKENLRDGMDCPCCGQLAKLYKRKLNSGMAYTLVWLVKEYQKNNGGWFHVQRVAPRRVVISNEIGKLAHWGLVIQRPKEDDETKKTSGEWKPTQKGIDFVNGKLSVRSHIYLYDNFPVGFSSALTTIQEALGNKFDYKELMNV